MKFEIHDYEIRLHNPIMKSDNKIHFLEDFCANKQKDFVIGFQTL